MGLGSRQVELGGGVQVSDIWRNLFVEISGSRWSSVGDRTFIDDTGTRFPLGIPLRIKATYLDVSLGWKLWGEGVATYIGGGAGIVQYSETSPFRENGDDLETRPTSYHVLLGFEVPLVRWLSVTGDARYRFVPNLLGTGGVSAVLKEDRFGGFQSAIGLSVGYGGSGRRRPQPPATPKVEPPRKIDSPASIAQSGVISQSAPVFLFPDRTRKPLRILEAGTSVRILQQTDEWVRVEFRDQQFGPRQGYVERKYVRIGK